MTNVYGVYYTLILITIGTDLFIVIKTMCLLVTVKPIRVDNFSMHLQLFISRILPVLLLTLLASCSTKQTPKPTTQHLPVTEIEEVALGTLSPEQHIELAKTLTTKSAVAELLIATKLFYQQNNYAKALLLADKTLPLIADQGIDNIEDKIQLVLIKVSSLQQLGYFDESYLQLHELEQYASDKFVTLTTTYYQLLSTALTQKKQPVAALTAQLFAYYYLSPSAQKPEQINSIWQRFQMLSQWQLNLLTLDRAPELKGWVALTTVANKFGSNKDQIRYHLTMWQKKFKHHSAGIIAKQLMAQELTEKTIENVAVILPLTGNQGSAGRAIQQGILASFAQDKAKTLHFVDSATVNWYGLTNELLTLNIDYVIGPLLKANVDKYISHTNIKTHSQNDYLLKANGNLFDSNSHIHTTHITNTTNENTVMVNTSAKTIDGLSSIDSDSAITSYLQAASNDKTIATLLLNMPTKAALTSKYTVLSMRPEDEAKQAAATLSRQDFKHPVVLSQNNSVSKRIAQAFASQWQHITGNEIDIVYFDSGKQMQTNIKATLAVDKSKARISKLKSRLNQKITAQSRNRRDIDMFYLVGTSEESRLVKPYIAVNISPFADVIPVFASSRSHSSQNDYSSNNDLQGLTFTEIPWLLADAQNTELATTSQALWPKRSDGLSRLFAMGYDSYQLINKIPLMQQAPYLQHWGQTGILKLGNDNVLTRSLLWGVYEHNKVVTTSIE